MRLRFHFESDNEGDWRALLSWLCVRCSQLVVTTRHQPPDALTKLSAVAADPIDQATVSEWPGTRLLFGGTALRSTFVIAPSMGDRLFALASSPWLWIEPALPEDLTFLTSDGATTAHSVTHERLFYVEAAHAEATDLLGRIPSLRFDDE